MVPQFAGLSLEVDGDAVQVPDLIPFLNQDVYAQLTANHLVMFTGEQAKPVAEKALNDGLKTNGHFATTYSTKKISQVADTLFAQAPVLANFIPFDSAQCNEAYVTLSGLAGYDQVGTYRSYMNETGMVGHASTMTMLNDVKPYALAAGTYTAAQYSFGCQLEDVYSLTLNADGKAMAEGEALTWALVDNALEISNDGETEACILLSQSDSGFACVSHDGYMGSTVTHYTKQ